MAGGGWERAHNLPASVANRIVGEEAIMSERVCLYYLLGGEGGGFWGEDLFGKAETGPERKRKCSA